MLRGVMAMRGGGAGHGTSGAPLPRGCFLLLPLLLLLLLLLVGEARSLTARQPHLALGSGNVKFRGGRSALMHPTVTSFSPPNNKRRQPSHHIMGGSSSSHFMPPSVVSRAPSTRFQVPGPAITPAPHTPRRHSNWMSRDANHPPQPTVIGFGLDAATPLRPVKWRQPQASRTRMEGGGGWAGMSSPAIQGKWQQHHTPVLPHSDTPSHRNDTFGLAISEDLSHVQDRTSGWQQPGPVVRESPVGGGNKPGSRGITRTMFNGRSSQTHGWPIAEEVNDDEEIDDGGRSLLDFNATSEYQPDDYSAYHEYDHSNTSWRSPEQTPSPAHGQEILTSQDVVEIQNLTSEADLHALLAERNITFDKLRVFLNSGAQKNDVLEFLKSPTPYSTTTTSPPVLSHPPNAPDISAVEKDYQDDVTRQVPPSTAETESGDDDTDRESKESTKKNKQEGRRRKGRRKNKKRKGNKRQKNSSDGGAPPSPQVNNTTETPGTLPEIPFTTTTATMGFLLPVTQPPTPTILTTSPSSARTSDAAIVSVTLVEATSSDSELETPGQTTFVEDAAPRRKNTHSTTKLGHGRNPKAFRPANPSPEPEQTITETEVNFVREKQRDDYVFPLRGLLIISGLMGALAVFTLVVLISYAVIKCSKKPVVNNYQVSEQQKPAGT